MEIATPRTVDTERARIQTLGASLDEYGLWARDSYVDRNNSNTPAPDYTNLDTESVLKIVMDGRFQFFLAGLHEELGEVLEKTEGPDEIPRAELIVRLLESGDLPAEQVHRLKNEFGDVMWYIANIVEFYAHKSSVHLGQFAVNYWEDHDGKWGQTEDEKSLALLMQPNADITTFYARSHLQLRSACQQMYRPKSNLTESSIGTETDSAPLLKKSLGNPGVIKIETRELQTSIGEYLLALNRFMPRLFGEGFGIPEVTAMNKEKLLGRIDRGTIFKTADCKGDER